MMSVGSFLSSSASRLEITRSPSNSNPGNVLGRDPVAMMMFLAFTVARPPAFWSISTVLPFPRRPWPRIGVTPFLSKRNLIPLVRRSLTWRLRLTAAPMSSS